MIWTVSNIKIEGIQFKEAGMLLTLLLGLSDLYTVQPVLFDINITKVHEESWTNIHPAKKTRRIGLDLPLELL